MESKNLLVPKHRKISKEEITDILEKHNLIDVFKLPKIRIKDPALAELEIELGDVIEITRFSFAGESKYFRVVIN